jgi:hypothetical protein
MNNIKKIIQYPLVFLIMISLTACKTAEYWPEAPLDRGHYTQINLAEHLQSLKLRDQDAIDFWKRMGLPNKLEEIHNSDPIDAGLHFAGYPNIDNIPPDKILVFYTSAKEVTVIVVAVGLNDDSVLDHEERIDLRFNGSEWNVEWAGYRQRCRRNYSQDWITGLCP